MLRKLARAKEAGGATVEFALCALLLVPTLLYAIYFFELTYAKLKVNEASRYVVWEMTAFGLSDWQNGNHDGRFAQARNAIMAEVQQRWGDDLDGATPTLIADYKANKPITLEVSFDQSQVELNNVDPGIFALGGADLSGVAGQLWGWFGFNDKGKAQGRVTAKVKNTWLSRINTMPIGETGKMLTMEELTIGCNQSLIADQWDLKQGQKVMEDKALGTCNSDYCKQVDRMTYFGIGDEISDNIGGLGDFLGHVGYHFPLTTTVASLPMHGGTGSGNLDSSVKLQIAKIPNHSPLCKHYTNTYKDTQTAANSDYYNTYTYLGQYYMGCPKELQQEHNGSADGTCQYPTAAKPAASVGCN